MSAEVPVQHPPSAFKINRAGGAPMDALPFSPPPPSVPVFMAAVLEPILAVATFLAVLELMKTGEIQVYQEHTFDDIIITSDEGLRQGV